MLKEIETSILNKLKVIPKIKLVAEPVVDFSDVRQNLILNLQYTGETFKSPNENKSQWVSLPTKKRISYISFSLYIYYKELRKQFHDVYELFDRIIDILHGEVLEIQDLENRISPLYITNIEFVERNSSSFLVYKCNIELKSIS